MATTNSSRIEAATRLYVGKTLTGEQIKFAVRQMFPDETAACYPSDCAFTLKADGTLQPRTNTQHTDKSEGVLAYKGTDAFLVMPTDKIYRKAGNTRGRGTAIPKSDEQLAKELAVLANPVASSKVDGKVQKQPAANA